MTATLLTSFLGRQCLAWKTLQQVNWGARVQTTGCVISGQPAALLSVYPLINFFFFFAYFSNVNVSTSISQR